MDLKEKSKKYFAANPSEKEVFGAGAFLFKTKKDAINHAATLETNVETFVNEGQSDLNLEPSILSGNQATVIAEIPNLGSEELSALLEQEKEGKNRVKVIAAIENQIETLSNGTSEN